MHVATRLIAVNLRSIVKAAPARYSTDRSYGHFRRVHRMPWQSTVCCRFPLSLPRSYANRRRAWPPRYRGAFRLELSPASVSFSDCWATSSARPCSMVTSDSSSAWRTSRRFLLDNTLGVQFVLTYLAFQFDGCFSPLIDRFIGALQQLFACLGLQGGRHFWICSDRQETQSTQSRDPSAPAAYSRLVSFIRWLGQQVRRRQHLAEAVDRA